MASTMLQRGSRLMNHVSTFLYPRCKVLVIPVAHKMTFFDYDRHSGYGTEKKPSTLEHLKRGRKMLRGEFKKLGQELTPKNDFVIDANHGDYLVQFKFDNQEMIDDWVVTSDNDNLEGYSHNELVLSQNRTALWRGYINTEVPGTGYLDKTGYCNITSPYKYRSFKRKIPYNWSHFTHLVVRCRGDGRKYQINISILSIYDMLSSDMYNYTLYTRGGPYWENVEIPFSKFYLSSKGRIQDQQMPLGCSLNRIATIGFTQADGISGPFELEIDSITTVYDGSHSEKTAYEQYDYPVL